jgi:hypothetical protein
MGDAGCEQQTGQGTVWTEVCFLAGYLTILSVLAIYSVKYTTMMVKQLVE